MDAVESFESYRSYLFAVAYRMLGSAMDAEDMVQETFLRYRATPPESVVSPKAFLTTIITRLCVDQLHRARRTRETYLGPWLPEPILTAPAPGPINPAELIDDAESISLAFLVLLEQLQPVERAVFLLHEVFDYDYAEIATFLDKSEVACRQWLSRAKKHLAENRPRFAPAPGTHQELLAGFVRAARAGDMNTLMTILAEDVTLWADGGGKVRGAATRPIFGREAVARFSIGAGRDFLPAAYDVEVAEVNRQPAMVIRSGGQALLVLTVDVEGEHIRAIRIVANPEKLARV